MYVFAATPLKSSRSSLSPVPSLSQSNVNGESPPEILISIDPLKSLKQFRFVIEDVKIKASG